MLKLKLGVGKGEICNTLNKKDFLKTEVVMVQKEAKISY